MKEDELIAVYENLMFAASVTASIQYVGRYSQILAPKTFAKIAALRSGSGQRG